MPPPCAPWCLFLDIDGTLLALADTPDGVEVDESLPTLLESLRAAAGGAVALVSGRTIADVDHLLGIQRFPVAGQHGSEIRDAQGHLHRAPINTAQLGRLRAELQLMVASNPALLLEDKGSAIALHTVRAPESHSELHHEVALLAAALAPDFVTMEGRAVIEIRPAGYTKGSAVDAYMRHTPFAQRRPIFIGDDTTDYDGFAAVARHSGLAIAVGPRVSATWWLPDPPAVRCWLGGLLERS